jgi:cytoskeletal protein CcmA (bactofilin family)
MQPTRLKERMCELKTNLSTISEEQNQPVPPSPSPTMEPTHPSGSMAASRATTMQPTPTSASPATAVQATIDKSMEVNGDVIGSESLYIDGKVKGTINLPGSRVTIGRNGRVSGNISAREVVVLGEVRGDINASERVDLRSEGSLTGDVIAQHTSLLEMAPSLRASSTSRSQAKETMGWRPEEFRAPSRKKPSPLRRRASGIRELARRGEALGTSESRQMLEYAISVRGGIYLKLTPKQYARLKRL